MHLDRLRHGEWLLLTAAVALLVVLCLDWYDPHAAGGHFLVVLASADFHTTGIASVGWFAAGVTLLAILASLAVAAATVTQDSPAVPVGLSVLTILLGILASISLLARLVLQPGLGIGLGNAQVDLRWTAYIGPLLAILLTVGAWRALADERTDAATSDAADAPLRPIPE